jgi:uncharacterized membrane protein YuzA (DUF378 family)
MVIRKHWVYIFAILFMVVGSLNWLSIGTTGINIVEKYIGNGYLTSIIYILVGLSALSLMFHRDTYLPFLGKTAFPCSLLADKVPNDATVSIPIKVKPESKVVYWASEHHRDMAVASNPWEAYAKYENSGIVTADKDGNATIKIRDPIKYNVPLGRKLDKHVHYRFCKTPGMISEVFTVMV